MRNDPIDEIDCLIVFVAIFSSPFYGHRFNGVGGGLQCNLRGLDGKMHYASLIPHGTHFQPAGVTHRLQCKMTLLIRGSSSATRDLEDRRSSNGLLLLVVNDRSTYPHLRPHGLAAYKKQQDTHIYAIEERGFSHNTTSNPKYTTC